MGYVFLYGLSGHVHADGKDRGAASFDVGGFIPGADGGFIAVAGAVGTWLFEDMVIKKPTVIIGIVTVVAAADIGGGKAVAEEDDEFISVGDSVQHIAGHREACFNVGKTGMGRIVAGGIDNGARPGSHGVLEGVGLFLCGAALKAKHLVRVGVEGHKAHFADAKGIVRSKLIQKAFRSVHGGVIPGGAAKIGVHGIGNVQNNDHRHVRLHHILRNVFPGAHVQRNVKDVFQLGAPDGLANRDSPIPTGSGTAGAFDLNV